MSGTEMREAAVNLVELLKALAGDAKFAIVVSQDLGDTQETRRIRARALMAFVEGTAHALKRFALAVHAERGGLFCESEVAMLRSVTYDLDDAGRAVEQQKFVRFVPNIRFAIDAFAKANSYGQAADYSCPGWQALREAVRIRNRLAHPRTPADLLLSEQDIETVDRGVTWFQDETGRIFTANRPRDGTAGV